jgi:uncharacterized membrane protein (UPF0127 family)
MPMFRFFILLFALLPWPSWAASTAPLNIETADGRSLPFTIELAQTPEELERGLMNRASMPADAGMLFNFALDRPVAMWMKNTVIPLDIVFILGDGTIAGIAQRAVPMSLAIIPSPGPVRAVLELNGGTADRLGIKIGDKVGYPLFKQ